MQENQLFFTPPAQSGKGFDDFQARCGAIFEPFRMCPERRRTDFQWCTNVKTGHGLSLVRIQCNSGWSLTQDGDRRGFSVFIPRVGGYEATLDKRQVEVAPGKILLAPIQQVRHIKLYSNDMRPGIALTFDDTTVTKVLSSLSNDKVVDCRDVMPVLESSSQVGTTLREMAQLVEAGTFASQALQKSPKAAALLTEAALTFIFENVPHRGIERIQRQAPLVAPRHVRAAVDYMHAHLHQSLTMADIAAAVGVSVRSLQAAFRRFYDTTPMNYLRRLRLEAVHQELASPENRLPVSEVALKWGFVHLGRFAAQYRAAYGVYPSATATKAHLMLH
ncbi:hypothetical protein L861_22040 [Litchfieldella anticariensis FP35 = DSM 16096]|uniref:HTH araC/xylS-type domain-containing protein n=1 Tax=Litchfieldella anticariensis (strain DSM 16096 / CECT 5854 / CIP 108499 / LMG 22089 / FP35) TaxID=1121939 RepID=S2L5K9_LITA3|nr:AraC family transcriptional regulator [Halomonas anticariensis]EPC02994.1 hypothetical protein L861_22040 [Halomonas anticariensis FP35 = DSM 16096]